MVLFYLDLDFTGDSVAGYKKQKKPYSIRCKAFGFNSLDDYLRRRLSNAVTPMVVAVAAAEMTMALAISFASSIHSE